MDSGATHHFTPDITMIQYPSAYQGNEQVIVGNGKKLSISHVGHAYLPSKHKSLLLKNVLHTPYLTTNLLSVQKLCKDNDAYVEFHSDYFFVKNQGSKEILL